MISQMVRPELREDDYFFNEQEFKEYHLTRIDPYWKVRGTCFSLNVNWLGDRKELTRRIENLLFQNYLHQKPDSSQLKDQADADIDVFIKNLKYTTKQYDDITLSEIFEAENNHDVIEEKITTHLLPWTIVPELIRMDRKLTYLDVQQGMVPLMRSTMVFYNHFVEEECLSAIIAFPYTPRMLDYLSPAQLFALVKCLGMRYDYPNAVSIVDVYKQKLLDLWYAVEDNPRLHGITMCQTQTQNTNNLASQFCPNNMSKLECQNIQHKMPCIVHDSFEQFSRYKLRSVYSFEEHQSFDRSRTLRLYCRKTPRKYDLEAAFVGTGAVWGERNIIYYHYSTNRIEYIYIIFDSQESALQVYKDRHILELKLEKYDVQIQALNESFWKAIEKFEEPENVLVLIKPLSSLEIVEDLPKGPEYLVMIRNMVEMVTQLGPGSFVLYEDVNPLLQSEQQIADTERLQNHVYIVLPNREYVEKLYNSQPYFGCLVAHKLSHTLPLPYLRYHPNMCLMCTSQKDSHCFYDMCTSCCSRQKFGILSCPCSKKMIQEMNNARGALLENEEDEKNMCEQCTNAVDEKVAGETLCEECYRIQFFRNDCFQYDISEFAKGMVSLSPFEFGRKCLQIVGEMHLRVRDDMKNGRYDWFRPFYNSHIQNQLIEANRNLQIVQDNGALVRGAGTSRFKREGQIFTLQANQTISVWSSNSTKSFENINKKGEPYVQYYFTEYACKAPQQTWVKNGPNKYRTYAIDEYENYIKAPQLKINHQFHVIMLGLNQKCNTVKELYRELESKLTQCVGQIKQENIMIIDNETLISDIFQNPAFLGLPNLEQNIQNLGRIACLRFDNIVDALSLLVKECRVTMLLENGKTDEPQIYPSGFLLKWIEEFNPNTVSLDYSTAGNAFTKVNNEIEVIQTQYQNLLNFGLKPEGGGRGRGAGGRGGRGRGRGGRGGDAGGDEEEGGDDGGGFQKNFGNNKGRGRGGGHAFGGNPSKQFKFNN